MTTIILILLVLGLNAIFWTLVGLGRFAHARWHKRQVDLSAPASFPTPADVAVIVAAHNEELVIEETIRRISRLVDSSQVHIVSDGSKDATAEIARNCGAQVLELNPNRGKAGALAAGIEHFQLCDRYQVVMLLDADTQVSDDYLETGLPLFAEPDVVAVAGTAQTIFDPPSPTLMGRLLVAYRERLYVATQLLLKYGQAAKWANAVYIVPGFASLYRTSALRQIDVTAPGLVIEDFNMTFEVHRKKLGRIEFHPGTALARTQDPDRFGDYRKQMRRWLLGFWQTVRRHGMHGGIFWVALGCFIVELVLACLMWVLVLPLFLISLAATVMVSTTSTPDLWLSWLSGLIRPENILLGIVLPDYCLTVLAAIVRRRWSYFIYGLAFPLMRIVDAALCLAQLPRAWSARSTGAWVSPSRRIAVGNASKG